MGYVKIVYKDGQYCCMVEHMGGFGVEPEMNSPARETLTEIAFKQRAFVAAVQYGLQSVDKTSGT